MNIFFYTSELNQAGCKLRQQLQHHFAAGQMALFSDIDDLRSYLGLAMKNNDIVVLAISNDQELEALVQQRTLLEDTRLILQLSSQDPPGLAKAHLLRPRFISSDAEDTAAIEAVVEKMMSKQGTGETTH